MGFLSGLGKVLKGEPVFEPTKPAAEMPGESQDETVEHTVSPVVMIGRVECSVSGQRMDVYGDIHNGSSELLYLDKVNLLGMHEELDVSLKPGESRQFLLYRGSVLTALPHGYADVEYRTEAGHYYIAQHQIHVRKEPYGYQVTEFELDMPIRNVH